MLFDKWLCSIFSITCVWSSLQAQVDGYLNVPNKCKPYVNYFLDSSNPHRELAQTEQESGCNRFAESAYAKGLRQFTDRTGEWLSLTHCKHLGDYEPFNENWSIQCGLIFMELLESNNDYGDYCFNRQVAEAEYNGGAWIVWELKHTNNQSLKEARKVCGTTKLYNGRKRALWACKENYEYPEHITRRAKKYSSLGGQVCN